MEERDYKYLYLVEYETDHGRERTLVESGSHEASVGDLVEFVQGVETHVGVVKRTAFANVKGDEVYFLLREVLDKADRLSAVWRKVFSGEQYGDPA